MQTTQEHQSSSQLYHQPAQENSSCYYHILDNNNISSDNGSQGGSHSSSQACNAQFFTLESSSSTANSYVLHNSPSAISMSSSTSPGSYYSDNTYGSPLSGSSSVVDGGNELRNKLRELEISLLGPESHIVDNCLCSFSNGVIHQDSRLNQMVEMIPKLDLKQVILTCAHAMSDCNFSAVSGLMDVLEQMVSVSGNPIQRLGAYVLEGLRARMEATGSLICRKLKCEEPPSAELMSYMHVLYQICPYYKFAYMSSNVIIGEAMENESRIHIIDFQIAQGSQWVSFIKALSVRPGGPPDVRITGVDDSNSAYARGGGLHIVGERLSKFAESCRVPFEFHGAGMSGCQVELDNLRVQPGEEALAVNFPYMLHHMPDESVSTVNHRDRLLRLIKSLSPKVVTLVEQESNTNTAPFLARVSETLDYYSAMFESIDVARRRDDKQRINAEQHCLARDIVNVIACEGAERVERHELLGKWRARFTMAGFRQYPLSQSVGDAIRDMLKDYNENYRLEERDGALYLCWKIRALATCCAWS